MTDPNCIFCKIIEGVIPSYKVYEDENFFGFLTNNGGAKSTVEKWINLFYRRT